VVCRTKPDAPSAEGTSIIAVEGPAAGVKFERAIDSIGHRAHLVPVFGLQNVVAPRHNLLGKEGDAGGIRLCAQVRQNGEARRHPSDYRAPGGRLRAGRRQNGDGIASWRACHALDTQSPGADELAIQAKIYGSETAVRVITELMRVVGIESYDHETPFAARQPQSNSKTVPRSSRP
jgi:nitroalkane oxidase